MVWVIRWSRFVTGLFTVGLSVLAVRCGGESVVQGTGGRGGQSGGSGGTGGSGVSASGGVGATGMGARGGTSSVGGTTPAGAGGMPSAGFGGMPFGGVPGAGFGGFSPGGMGGDAFAHCTPQPFPYGACTFEDTCDALGCGEATSLHREDGCLRTKCGSDVDCADDERCIAAPLTGIYVSGFSSVCDGCEYDEGECICSCSLDVARLAVCLTMEEIPPACPVTDLSCAQLDTGIMNFQEYLDDGRFQGDLRLRLDECRRKFIARREEQCLGQGGAGGEGGSG